MSYSIMSKTFPFHKYYVGNISKLYLNLVQSYTWCSSVESPSKFCLTRTLVSLPWSSAASRCLGSLPATMLATLVAFM